MKSDRHEQWRTRGQRFEVFRPKYENPQPSEWYVPLYALLRPWVLLGFGDGKASGTTKKEKEIIATRSGGSFWTKRLFFWRRRAEKVQEPSGRQDEGWVL